MTSLARLASPVSSYAARLHAVLGTSHHVASPLGAWLVLALAAPAAQGPSRDELAQVLGTGVEDAASAAGTLLAAPHPAVAAAAAMWHRAEFESDAFLDWASRLPDPVERGAVPNQAGADEWARRHTSGLIDRFPIQIRQNTALVLASALATRVSWTKPFELVDAGALGAGKWATQLGQVLRTPESGHDQFIARTSRAGEVAVQTARSQNGLAVTSVIASTDVSAADVLVAAHEVALADDPPRVSLFDLPLGDTPLWTISEQPAELTQAREERCTAVLPAWEARSEHGLNDPSLGFPAAADSLIGLLPPGDYDWDAKQAAMARYSRTGFQAAAVTSVGIRALAYREPREGLLRQAVLRFAHPYAVVAVCDGGGAWDGLPVFSAWVASPSDASTETQE